MPSHDFVISNGTGAAVRSDLNGALAAIVSNSSGSSEPSTKYAYQWWADTTTGQLKLRNSANNAWITIFELDGTMLMEDGTVSAPGLAFASDLNTGFFRSAADTLNFATGGVERLRVNNLGNVGINASNPDYKLHAIEPTNDAVALFDSNNVNGAHIRFGKSAALKHFFGCASGFGAGDADDLGYRAFDQHIWLQGSTEFMRLDSSGKLGIGTSSPDFGLHLHSSSSYLKISNSGTGEGDHDGLIVGIDGTGNCDIWNYENKITRFATNNTERMRITTSTDGQLLIGTTNGASNSGPGVKLSGGSASTVDVVINAASNINLNHVYNINATNNGYRFYIMANGGVANHSGNNVNLSDEREKKNIVDMDSVWSDLKQWVLREFHFNDEDDSEPKHYGVIAQQIETVSPQVLSTFETNPTTIRKGIKEQKMMWMAIKALQEAQTRIETLETKVAALEAG